MGIEGYYEDYFDERQDEKLTNFQKIKNMSLDEMAELFDDWGYMDEPITSKLIGSIKQWLQEESE